MRYITPNNNSVRYTEKEYLVDFETIHIREKFEGNFLLLLNKYGIIPTVLNDYGFEWKFEFLGINFEVHETKASDEDIYFYKNSIDDIYGSCFVEMSMDELFKKLEKTFNNLVIEDFKNKNKVYEYKSSLYKLKDERISKTPTN